MRELQYKTVWRNSAQRGIEWRLTKTYLFAMDMIAKTTNATKNMNISKTALAREEEEEEGS